LSAKVHDIREGLLKKLNREFSEATMEMSQLAEYLQNDLDPEDKEQLEAEYHVRLEKCNELEVQIATLEEELFGVKSEG
jgi:hypothetical protein